MLREKNNFFLAMSRLTRVLISVSFLAAVPNRTCRPQHLRGL